MAVTKLQVDTQDSAAKLRLVRIEAKEAGEEIDKLIVISGKLKAPLAKLATGANRAVEALRKSSGKARTAAKSYTAAGKAAEKAGKQARKSAKGFNTMATGTGDARLKAAALITTLIALRSIVGSVSAYATFEEAMSSVKAVTGATEDQMASMLAVARDLGATTRFTATQVAEGMVFLGRTGLNTQEIISALPATLDLATAGVLELGTAADITTNIMAAFGLETEESRTVVDALAAVAAGSNTDIQQIGEAMKFVGPVAKAFKVSMQDTAAAVGVLSDRGIQAEKAGTGIRAIIAALVNPSDDATAAIERLGLTVEQLSPVTNSLGDIVNRLAGANNLAAESFAIFQRKGATAALALVAGADDLERFTGAVNDSGGASRDMAEIMDDNLAGAGRRLNSVFESLQISMVDEMNPALRGSAEEMTALMERSTEAAKEMGENLGGAITVLSKALLFVAENIEIVKAAGFALLAVKLAAWANAATVALTAMLVPASALVAPLAAIAAAASLANSAIKKWTSESNKELHALGNENSDLRDGFKLTADQMAKMSKTELSARLVELKEKAALVRGEIANGKSVMKGYEQSLADMGSMSSVWKEESDKLRGSLNETKAAVALSEKEGRLLEEAISGLEATMQDAATSTEDAGDAAKDTAADLLILKNKADAAAAAMKKLTAPFSLEFEFSVLTETASLMTEYGLTAAQAGKLAQASLDLKAAGHEDMLSDMIAKWLEFQETLRETKDLIESIADEQVKEIILQVTGSVELAPFESDRKPLFEQDGVTGVSPEGNPAGFDEVAESIAKATKESKLMEKAMDGIGSSATLASALLGETDTALGRFAQSFANFLQILNDPNASAAQKSAAGGGLVASGIAATGFGNQDTTVFGGLGSGNYVQEGAEAGAAVGGVYGAVIGAFIGAFVSKNADEAKISFDEEMNAAVVEFAQGGLGPAAEKLQSALTGFVQGFEKFSGLELDTAGVTLEILGEVLLVTVNGAQAGFRDMASALAWMGQELLQVNGRVEEFAEALGPNVAALIENLNSLDVYGTFEDLNEALLLAFQLDANDVDLGLDLAPEALTNQVDQWEAQSKRWMVLAGQYGLSFKSVSDLTNKALQKIMDSVSQQAGALLGVSDSLSPVLAVAASMKLMNKASEDLTASNKAAAAAAAERAIAIQAEIDGLDKSANGLTAGMSQATTGIDGLSISASELRRGLAVTGMGDFGSQIVDTSKEAFEGVKDFAALTRELEIATDEANALADAVGPEGFDAQEIMDILMSGVHKGAESLLGKMQEVMGVQFGSAELERAKVGLWRLQAQAEINQMRLMIEMMSELDDVTRAYMAGLANMAQDALNSVTDQQIGQALGGRGGGGGGRRRAAREEAERARESALDRLAALEELAAGAATAVEAALEDLADAFDLAEELGGEEAARATAAGLSLFADALEELVGSAGDAAGVAAAFEQLSEALAAGDLSEGARAAIEDALEALGERASEILNESFEASRDTVADAVASGDVDAVRAARQAMVAEWAALPEEMRPTFEEFQSQMREVFGGTVRDAAEIFASMAVADVGAFSADPAIGRWKAFQAAIDKANKALQISELSEAERARLMLELAEDVNRGIIKFQGESAQGMLGMIAAIQDATGEQIATEEELQELRDFAFEMQRVAWQMQIEQALLMGTISAETAARMLETIAGLTEAASEIPDPPGGGGFGGGSGSGGGSSGSAGETVQDVIDDIDAWMARVVGISEPLREMVLEIEGSFVSLFRRLQEATGPGFGEGIERLIEVFAAAREAAREQILDVFREDDSNTFGAQRDAFLDQVRDARAALVELYTDIPQIFPGTNDPIDDLEGLAAAQAELALEAAAAWGRFMEDLLSGLDGLESSLKDIAGISAIQPRDFREVEAEALDLFARAQAGDQDAIDRLLSGEFQDILANSITGTFGTGAESQAQAAQFLALIQSLRDNPPEIDLGDTDGEPRPETIEDIMGTLPGLAEQQLETMQSIDRTLTDALLGQGGTLRSEIFERGLGGENQEVIVFMLNEIRGLREESKRHGVELLEANGENTDRIAGLAEDANAQRSDALDAAASEVGEIPETGTLN